MYFDFHPTTTGSFAATSSGTWNGQTFNITLTGVGTRPADTTPPVLTVPGGIVVDATSPAGAAVAFAVTATDDQDPHPTVACSPSSGSVFPIGPTSVHCTATDASGNSAAASFTILVKGAAAQLADLAAAVVGVGRGRSLSATVGAARRLLAHGRIRATGIMLEVFVHQVKAQTGRWIPGEQAAALIAAASRIRDVLGSTR
jgi:hypothetical protein